MLFLLTRNGRSAVNLEKAQNLSIVERLGVYELVYFRGDSQCVIINNFRTEDRAKEFLEYLLDYIANEDIKKRKVITCDNIYYYGAQREKEALITREKK